MNQLMKNFEKRFTFAKVINKHQVAYFLGTQLFNNSVVVSNSAIQSTASKTRIRNGTLTL